MSILLLFSPITIPLSYSINPEQILDGEQNKIRYQKSEKPSDQIQVTAYMEGMVTDLGTQNYMISGKGGTLYYLNDFNILDTVISFELHATVVDEALTGKMKLGIVIKTDSGPVNLQMNLPVIGGDPVYGCLDQATYELITCPPRPWSSNILPYLELENGDFIPIIFFGTGQANLNIGIDDEIIPIFIMVDTSRAQHPFKGEGNTGQLKIKGCYPTDFACISESNALGIFALSVDVINFNVRYSEVETAGEVSGDMVGLMTQTVRSIEDHVKNVQKDNGQIMFSLIYNDKEIIMAGIFNGESVQVPQLGYLYLSTGKFNTNGDITIKGIYETIWTLPLFFICAFTGTITH